MAHRKADRLRSGRGLANMTIQPVPDMIAGERFDWAPLPPGTKACLVYDTPANKAILLGYLLPNAISGAGGKRDLGGGLYAMAFSDIEDPDCLIRRLRRSENLSVRMGRVGAEYNPSSVLGKFYGTQAERHAFHIVTNGDNIPEREQIAKELADRAKSYLR
jgi:hypothetical protein